MAAFTPTEWRDFFVGSVGASAALTGLLFVAISINLQQILRFPHLPGRRRAPSGYCSVRWSCGCVGLAPGQPFTAVGAEITVTGAAVSFQAVLVTAGTVPQTSG